MRTPNCTICGRPMSFDERKQQWFCSTDDANLTHDQADNFPRKPKRNWRRILATALICTLPCTNPYFFISAYDRRHLRKSRCPSCKSSATEVANRTLRLRNKSLETILECRCQTCGAQWKKTDASAASFSIDGVRFSS